MNNKLKSFACIIILTLVISACSNPVDSALNKEEAAISRYEKKAANKEATAKDLQELQTEISAIDLKFKDHVAEKDITPQQMQRGQDLAERYAHIMMNNAFDGLGEDR